MYQPWENFSRWFQLRVYYVTDLITLCLQTFLNFNFNWGGGAATWQSPFGCTPAAQYIVISNSRQNVKLTSSACYGMAVWNTMAECLVCSAKCIQAIRQSELDRYNTDVVKSFCPHKMISSTWKRHSERSCLMHTIWYYLQKKNIIFSPQAA